MVLKFGFSSTKAAHAVSSSGWMSHAASSAGWILRRFFPRFGIDFHARRRRCDRDCDIMLSRKWVLFSIHASYMKVRKAVRIFLSAEPRAFGFGMCVFRKVAAGTEIMPVYTAIIWAFCSRLCIAMRFGWMCSPRAAMAAAFASALGGCRSSCEPGGCSAGRRKVTGRGWGMQLCLCRAPDRLTEHDLPHLGQFALGLAGWTVGGVARAALGVRAGGVELEAPFCSCIWSAQSWAKSLPLGAEYVRSFWHLGQTPRSFPVSGCLYRDCGSCCVLDCCRSTVADS